MKIKKTELYQLREAALFFVQEKNKALKNKYTGFEVVQNLDYDWWLEYYDIHKTPFVDIMYYPFIFKDNFVYIDTEQYTAALNQVLRTYVLRIKTDGTFSEAFSQEIYKNESNNPEFQIFIDKILALRKDQTLMELYQEIVFNEGINYIKKEDILELFKALSKIGLMQDLDKDYFKLNFEMSPDEFNSFQFGTGTYDKFNDTEVGLKKAQMFYLKNYKKIQSLGTKFNIIPEKGSTLKMNINKIFFSVDNQVSFLPQFLLLFRG